MPKLVDLVRANKVKIVQENRFSLAKGEFSEIQLAGRFNVNDFEYFADYEDLRIF